MPCSGSGSWRRDPQGKWALTAERLAAFGQIESLEGRAVSLLVPREQLTDVVARMLGELEVDDLEVSDPPIEELIGRKIQCEMPPDELLKPVPRKH